MTNTQVFSESVKFLSTNFRQILPYLLLPLAGTIALFIALVFASYFLVSWLHSLLKLESGFLSKAAAISMYLLGGVLVVIILYLFFIPIWQLLIMPLMEGFMIKVCKIYSAKNNIILNTNNGACLSTFIASTKISLSIFLRQIMFRLTLTILIFFIPLLGICTPFVDFISNFLYGYYEYFNSLFATFYHPQVNFRNLNNTLAIHRIPPTGFKIYSALMLSIPVFNIFGIFINAVATTILFCEKIRQT
jgi:uncharacterized protein involved in cysteine biosynthesis